MNDIVAVIKGLSGATSVIALLAFIFAYFKAKGESKKGPVIISIEGKLNLGVKDLIIQLITAWLVAMAVFVVTAFGLAQAGESGIMPLSIFAAGIASFFYSKKNILKVARYKNEHKI